MPLIIEAALRTEALVLKLAGIRHIGILRELNIKGHAEYLDAAFDLSSPVQSKTPEGDEVSSYLARDRTRTAQVNLQKSIWVESEPTPSEEIDRMVSEGRDDLMIRYAESRSLRNLTDDEIAQIPHHAADALANVIQSWEARTSQAATNP
jgi:hypothetical protein